MGIIDRFLKNYDERKKRLDENGLIPYIRNSSGYVLIIILIMTTLLVSIAGEFIVMAQVNIGYSQKLKNHLRALYFARSGVQLCQAILYADTKGIGAEMITGKATDKEIDSYNDIWAINFPEYPIIEDCTWKIQIIDENSKINLSVLANEFTERTKYYFFTQNFFMNMGLPMDLADVIHDWVDIDDSRMPYGAESQDYYATLKPPYTAKNNAMDSIDELLMLKDFTPNIYYGWSGGNFEAEKNEQNLVEHNKGDVDLNIDKLEELAGEKASKKVSPREKNLELPAIGKEKSRRLSDYFTVYGDRQDYTSDLNKININTASYRVLSALTDKMTPDIVTEIIRRRLAQPFKSVDEIKDLIKDQTILDRLSVKSSIFRFIVTATVNDVPATITVVYNRSLKTLLYWCEE